MLSIFITKHELPKTAFIVKLTFYRRKGECKNHIAFKATLYELNYIEHIRKLFKYLKQISIVCTCTSLYHIAITAFHSIKYYV